MAQEEELLGKAYDSRLMKRVMRYLRPYRWQGILAVVLTLCISALVSLRPYLISVAVDQHIIPKKLEGLNTIFILLVGSILFQALFQHLQTLITQWRGQ